MNTERILSAGIAVVVVVAVGLSASTLASSMSTDPADAVDVDRDALPLGDDAEGAVMAAAQGIHDQYSADGDGQADGSANDGDSEGESAADADEREQSADQSDGGETSERSAQQSGGASESSASDSGIGLAPVGWPLWLAALLVGVVALAYRYRDRLRRHFERDGDRASAEPLVPAPENEVERAWAELLQRAGVPQSRTRTPRDCARLAVETGYDRAVVDRLRRAFEDVRYGSRPPTDEQARVARDALARLDGERP